jgi:hypothetical protein
MYDGPIGNYNNQILELFQEIEKIKRIKPVNHFQLYSKKCIFAT